MTIHGQQRFAPDLGIFHRAPHDPKKAPMTVFAATSLRVRLILGFCAVLVLLMALTAFSIVQVNAIDETLNRINTQNSVKQRHAIDFRGSVHDRAIAVRDLVLLTDDTALRAVEQDIRRLETFMPMRRASWTR
ncbi:MCP four helix bundle domain-containing protein [Tistrella bauzanensis]